MTVPAGAYIGEIRTFAIPTSNTAAITVLHGQGWAECDGSSLNKLTFPDLFKAIGATWGSRDPANVFSLPDLRGFFVRGWNGREGHDPDAAHRSAPPNAPGDQVGSRQGHALQAHSHDNTAHRHDLPRYVGHASNASAFDQGDQAHFASHTDAVKIDILGPIRLGPHPSVQVADETRPVNVAVLYFIQVGKAFSPDMIDRG